MKLALIFSFLALLLSTYNFYFLSRLPQKEEPRQITKYDVVLECQKLSAATIDKSRKDDGKTITWEYKNCVEELMKTLNVTQFL